MDDEEQGGFKWEKAYTESLGINIALQEDEQGSIANSVRRIISESKRQRRSVANNQQVRLGIMRYLYICIDMSDAMISQEPYPSRLKVTIDLLLKFLETFFELNPLAQIGLIICRDKHSERLQGFTSSIHLLKKALSNMSDGYCSGEFSLNAALHMALQSYQGLPTHSSKEILLVTSNLSTVDAGSLNQTFEVLKMRSIRCSIISFSAEVFVYKKLCSTTAGKYSVVLNEKHLELLMHDHLQPPPQHRRQGVSVVRIGFPSRTDLTFPSFCMCHDSTAGKDGAEKGSKDRAYFCCQCGARYCQTPTECRICGLLLLNAPQLARAHQHFAQLAPFIEVSTNEKTNCFACDEPIPADHKAYECKDCHVKFCIDCDLLLHESLQICPAC